MHSMFSITSNTTICFQIQRFSIAKVITIKKKIITHREKQFRTINHFIVDEGDLIKHL